MTTTTVSLTSESERNLSSFNYNNIEFVNFDTIIDDAYKDVLRFCNNTGLELNFNKRDISKLFFNYIVVRTTQLYLSSKTKTCLLTCESLYTNDVLGNIYPKTVKKLQSLLPLRIINTPLVFDLFKNQISLKQPAAICLVDGVIAQIHNEDISTFSYRKLKMFLKREGFVGLYSVFTSNHKIKHALLYK